MAKNSLAYPSRFLLGQVLNYLLEGYRGLLSDEDKNKADVLTECMNDISALENIISFIEGMAFGISLKEVNSKESL